MECSFILYEVEGEECFRERPSPRTKYRIKNFVNFAQDATPAFSTKVSCT